MSCSISSRAGSTVPIPNSAWDGQGWIGTDYDKLRIRSEGTYSNGALTDGQQQFLYDRAITTYFDLQGGLRSDLDSRPARNWGAFGIPGPGALLLRSRTDRLRKLRGSLCRQARGLVRPADHPAAHPAAGNRAQPLQQGGPSPPGRRRIFRYRYRAAASLRVQPEICALSRVVYEGKFGQTANFARAAGESTGEVRFVLGVRTSF
jgi:copper resistance protein B